jgi:peptidoglycan/LPS O-acetylase OafA/YrhL
MVNRSLAEFPPLMVEIQPRKPVGQNNFNVLRVVAATMVIFAHSYDLENIPGLGDPLKMLTGKSLGWAGVGAFFVISGFLIMQSLERNPSVLRFARARALRIFPGLIVCVAATVTAMSFVTTKDAEEYWSAAQTLFYAVGNASLLSVQYELPGVFEANPYPKAVNGSLWTLPYEVVCYLCAAGLAMAGAIEKRRRWIFFALTLFAYVAFGMMAKPHWPLYHRLDNFHRLAFCFLLGMMAASIPGFKLRGWPVLCLVGFCFVMPKGFALSTAMSVAIAAIVFWLAFLASPTLRKLSSLPDYSYGIYVYAFPIQQSLFMWSDMPPLLNAGATCLLVLIPASASWHFIEKPALALKTSRREGVKGKNR